MTDPITAGLMRTAAFAPCLFLLVVGVVMVPAISAVASWVRTTGPWARRARESHQQQAFLRRMAQGRD